VPNPELRYVEGDVLALKDADPTTVLIPHVCNDVGVWGAGFVVPLGAKWPAARDRYAAWHRQIEIPPAATYPGGLTFKLGATQITEVQARTETDPRVIVCNMVAQRGVGGPRPLRYNALAACMDQVAGEAKKYADPVIRAPLFGAGLAGGTWEFIELLIADCWLARGLPVSIYYLRDRLPPGWTPPDKET
jgi:hypothetical protein